LRVGATVVGALTAAIVGAAPLLARPAPAAMVSDSFAAPASPVAPRHFVAGSVLDAEGDPAPGVAVRIRSEGRAGADWVTSSGVDGSFAIDGVAAGKVHVSVEDEGGAVESGALDVTDAHHVVLVLQRTLDIRGTILDVRGAPIGRATLKVARDGASRVVVADDDGRYEVRASPRANERITVWARGFEATSFDVGSVAPGRRYDVRLRAARPVRGVVVDPAGDVIAGARVSACPGNEAEVATSDRAGAFELPATVIGCWARADHAHFASSRAMHIRDGRNVVVRMGAGGAIEGDAVDEHGNPIGSFAVSIASFEPEEGVAVPGAPPEPSDHLRGAFRLEGLAPGAYVLLVSAEGRADVTTSSIQVTRGKVLRGQHVVLAPLGDAPGDDS
jgi:hypothetical protein